MNATDGVSEKRDALAIVLELAKAKDQEHKATVRTLVDIEFQVCLPLLGLSEAGL